MKKIFGLILVIGVGMTTYAGETFAKAATANKNLEKDNSEGIQFFEGTWKQALKKAKKENKLIFMDAYASWCGPCKLMARKTFTKKEVGDFFNKNFINYKMDMEKHSEGERLSNKYDLRAYPTLYFINSSEEKSHQELGYQKPEQLIAIGKKALK